jgi:hypothetical protein
MQNYKYLMKAKLLRVILTKKRAQIKFHLEFKLKID